MGVIRQGDQRNRGGGVRRNGLHRNRTGEPHYPCCFRCEAFCREAQALVPGIETVSVKGTQTTLETTCRKRCTENNKSAIHLHPVEARRRIKEGARKAMERAKKEDFGLIKLPPPYSRIRIMRGDSDYPPRILKQEHPSTLLEMRHLRGFSHELEINPPTRRGNLIGRQIA